MNKKEGTMNGENSPAVIIDLTEEGDEPTVDNSPENLIQEINVENVCIDEITVEKVNLRKYTKKQRSKNPESFFINNLGGFKYVLKKISEPKINNTSSYNKMKNYFDLDSMLKSNSFKLTEDEKNKPSTSASTSFVDDPFYNIRCVNESYSGNEIEYDTRVIFSKRINEEESSLSSETSRNIKRQRAINEVEEKSNSISSFNEMDTDDVLYSVINNENEEEYNMDKFVDYNYTEAESLASDQFDGQDMDETEDNFMEEGQDMDETEDNFMEEGQDMDETEEILIEGGQDMYETEDSFIEDGQDMDETEDNSMKDGQDIDETEDNSMKDGQDMDETDDNIMKNDQDTNTNVIYISDDDSDDEKIMSPAPKICEIYDLEKIKYIESHRLNIIFPNYSTEVFTELINFVSNKTKSEIIQPPTFKIEDLLVIFYPQRWLNDIVIEQYFKILVNNAMDETLDLGTHFLSYCKERGFESANRLISYKNVLDYKKLLVPIHVSGNHWALTVVNTKSRNLVYYDSIKRPNFKNEISVLVEYFKDLTKDIDELEVTEKKTNWTLTCGESPLQDNFNDCGVFTCTNARYFITDNQLNYSQEDIPLLRQRITYEIINNVLLPTE